MCRRLQTQRGSPNVKLKGDRPVSLHREWMVGAFTASEKPQFLRLLAKLVDSY